MIVKVAVLVDLYRENVDEFNMRVEDIINDLGGRLIHREISRLPIRILCAEGNKYPPAHIPLSRMARSGVNHAGNEAVHESTGMAREAPGRNSHASSERSSERYAGGRAGDERRCVDCRGDLGHHFGDRSRRADAYIRGCAVRLRQRKHRPNRAHSEDPRTNSLVRGGASRSGLRVPSLAKGTLIRNAPRNSPGGNLLSWLNP